MNQQVQPEVPKLSLIQQFQQHQYQLNQISSKDLITIEKGEIFQIDKFFPDQLCEELIKATECFNYRDALITTGKGIGVMDKSVRDSQRVMIDDIPVANLLLPIFRKIAPLCSDGAYLNSVNERFRYLKYFPEGKFAVHMDGQFPRGDEISIFTIHFYLNTVKKGGGTSFFKNDWDKVKLTVKSEIGKLAMFRQPGQVHQGDVVKEGLKYSVRNELMYKFFKDDDKIKLQNSPEFLSQQCGICKSNIKFHRKLKCGHHFIKCECPPFDKQTMDKYKGNIDDVIDKKQKGKCYLCYE